MVTMPRTDPRAGANATDATAVSALPAPRQLHALDQDIVR
ncbi:hypothetical protein BH24ACT4_BH24ACT4_16940 [soil metagenome]